MPQTSAPHPAAQLLQRSYYIPKPTFLSRDLQISDGKIRLFPLHLHDDIGGPAPLLPGVGQAARVHRYDAVPPVHHGLMGMPVHHDVEAPGLRIK